MADFEVVVRRLTDVKPHENADRLDIGQVDGYEFIIPKDKHQPGDLGVYIPEASILPDSIIEEVGLRNYLAGKEKNRVKAIRLRGHLSQGVFYIPANLELHEGEDVAEVLGITKYEPVVPLNLAGEVEAVPYGVLWPQFDLEDTKKYPDVIPDGELVSVTEKLHGTLGLFVWSQGRCFVASKGIAKQQLCLKEDGKANAYWRVAEQDGIFVKLANFAAQQNLQEVALIGEVLGVQDLMYGLKPGQLSFYGFALVTVNGLMPPNQLFPALTEIGVKPVPELYRGPFSIAKMRELTSGQTTIHGANHMREGVVVVPITERYDGRLGRVMVKSISPEYLLRKGGTEYN